MLTLNKVKDWVYRSIYTPIRVNHIRHKKAISVAFIITEVGVWKTEALYLLMKSHSRFSPRLIVLPSAEVNDTSSVEKYLQTRGYDYTLISCEHRISEKFSADIIFYQKPYSRVLYPKHKFTMRSSALSCFVNYGFHSIMATWALSQSLIENSWQVYYENESTKRDGSRVMSNGGKNIVVTGLPIMDELLQDKSLYKDPWRVQYHEKKRIIWAPHYSLPAPDNWLNYSTFLDYAHFMLEMAIKYQEEVQFAFKPHPLLKSRLISLWGEEEANAYYEKWSSLGNAQYEGGKYIDLFKYSDALIHDCGSFTIEYHYTQKPVMYLIHKEDNHEGGLTSFAKEAFNLHYMGKCKEDIETFIQSVVIQNNDPMKEKRLSFYKQNLLPPNGNSASRNIINAILGEL